MMLRKLGNLNLVKSISASGIVIEIFLAVVVPTVIIYSIFECSEGFTGMLTDMGC